MGDQNLAAGRSGGFDGTRRAPFRCLRRRHRSFPTHSAWFRQGDAAVCLTADSTACLDSARNALYSYDDGPPERGGLLSPWRVDVRVVTRVTSRDIRDCVSNGSQRDVGPELTAHVIDRVGRRLAWIPRMRTVVIADYERQSVTVRCTSIDAAVHWSCRLVRQVMTVQLLRAGAVYAHGAALVHQGTGVVVFGHRGAGKTTTLLAVLEHLGGSYVSNDRLLIMDTGRHMIALPWPTDLRVGAGTLAALPTLRDRLGEGGVKVDPRESTRNGKICIEPADFRHLGRDGTVTGSCAPAVMIWPELNSDGSSSSARRVPPAVVRDTLVANRMFMVDPKQATQSRTNHWIIDPPPASVTETRVRKVAAALAAQASCFQLSIGSDTAAVAETVACLLQLAGHS